MNVQLQRTCQELEQRQKVIALLANQAINATSLEPQFLLIAQVATFVLREPMNQLLNANLERTVQQMLKWISRVPMVASQQL
jgi:hypothetical protein